MRRISGKLKRIFCVLALAFLLAGCGAPRRIDDEAIFVRVPPLANRDLTAGENQCRFQFFLFPRKEKGVNDADVACKGATLANDDSLLYVSLSDDGSIWLNNVDHLADSESMRSRLLQIFDERTAQKVFEPESNRVVKAVGIRVRKSAKYSDFYAVLRAVKESGADPIVLLLDGHLPESAISSY